MAESLLILGWHNVEGTWCFPAPAGSGQRGLHRQLQVLRRICNVVPLHAALADLSVGRPLPPRAVALTFDDGYRDNIELVVPLLADLGLPATFFLVPALLSAEVEAWWEVLARAVTCTRRERLVWEGVDHTLASPTARRTTFAMVAESLKQRGFAARQQATNALLAELLPGEAGGTTDLFMDWDGAQRLVEAGFDVGSHSLRHAILSRESPGQQKQDLTTARALLRERLAVPVDLLAYPNGRTIDIDDKTVQAAVAAGHSAAVTTVPGWNTHHLSLMRLRRLVISPEKSWRVFANIGRHF